MSKLADNPRYQALHAARQVILSSASRRIPAAAAASQARALGLWNGREVAAGNDAQFSLMLDLGVFAPVGGHSPALDREVRAATPAPGTEAAEVLEALRHAHFTIFHIGEPNPEGGVQAQDVLRGMPIALLDAALETAGLQGCAFAGRLMRLDGHEMTCGVVAPVSDSVLQAVLGFPMPDAPPPTTLPALTPLTPEDLAALREAAKQPDFVVRVYRATLQSGLLGSMPGQ